MAWLFASSWLLAVGLLAVACGSSSKSSGSMTGVDSGSVADSSVVNMQGQDSTVSDSDAQMTDSTTMPVEEDAMIVVTDSGPPPLDSGSPADSAVAVDSAMTSLPDATLANCSPITGTCDIVSQNCGKGMECDSLEGPDGASSSTSCNPTVPSEHLPLGHSCCPSEFINNNPCAPGLQCIGNACSDAGPQTGRCSPACCLGPDGGNDLACGVSVPEGYPGHCDLTIVDGNNNPLYAVCDYSQNCRPFQLEPCPSGSACEVQNASGTATCSDIYNPGGDAGGIGPGQACTFGNSCADGLMCLGPLDGGTGACQYLCYVAGQNAPFDGGSLASAAPGLGGCPTNLNCVSQPSFLPNWLGICE